MPVAPPPAVAHDAAASRLDRAIVRAWLNSPSHRAVMLDPAYRRIGVCGKKGRMGRASAFLVTADFSTWR